MLMIRADLTDNTDRRAHARKDYRSVCSKREMLMDGRSLLLNRLWITWFVFVAGTVALNRPATAQNDELALQIGRMASQGQFKQMVDRVLSAEPGADTAGLAALHQDIRRYKDHQSASRLLSAKAMDRALQDMRNQVAKDDLTEALSFTVEASGLAKDLKTFLQRQAIVDLVRQSEARANEHLQKHEWLEALALYRRLDLLFDDQNRYDKPIKDSARHLRMLRQYAPDTWFAMTRDYAKAHGNPEPTRWDDPDLTWKKELEEINARMLRQAVAYAVKSHVEPCAYEQLLIGGLEGLDAMLQTRGLDQTFTPLSDTAKVNKFRATLKQIELDIRQQTTPMSYPDATAVLRRVMEANLTTIRLPTEVIVYEMTEGALGTLDDFTAMIWPNQIKRFERTTKQRFSGVGVQISLVNDELTVVTPLSGTPAQRAGLKPGDRIVAINGKPTIGISLEQAVEHITGPEGTTVDLGVRGPGAQKTRTVTLERKTIRIESVRGFDRRNGGKWDFYIDRENKIGYIRLLQFGPDSAEEMDKAVRQMRNDAGLSALILDLRFNPGGLLGSAVDVANRFLDSGVIVSGVKPGHQNGGFFGLGDPRSWRKSADSRHTYGDFPVVVLINRGSASASEIVAGALQAHGRAQILGERTYGKGSVQEIQNIDILPQTMRPRAQLKLTTQYYQLPNGRIIHRRAQSTTWGIEPDVPIRLTDRQTRRQIKARLILDILRDNGQQQVDIEAVVGDSENNDEPPLPKLTDAYDLIEHGLDPQVESALLLLRAQLLGKRVLVRGSD